MSRHTRLALAGAAILLLVTCLAGLIYLLSTYPLFTRSSPVSTPVGWSGLPVPAVLHPHWASFTAPQAIHDVALHDGLLWAATDGGVVVWDWVTGISARFTSEYGLAENVVTSTAVGTDGALWFGTATAGLSRYDGSSWRTFSTADGLPANHISDLAVTADGTVWAATTAGIGQYDGRRWYAHTRTRSFFQLPGDEVRALAVAPDGVVVWAATNEGVARWNGRRWESLAHTGSQGINDIQDIAITPDGLVWAATPGGLKQYDGRQWHIFTTGDGLASDALRQVTAAPDNTLWLAYADPADGVTLFDATGAVPTAQTAALPVAALQVAAVLPDGLLFSIPGGLFYADTGGAGRLFRAPADLPTHELTGLVVADSGVWAAGGRSMSRFDGAAWHTYTATQGLPDMATAALTLDPHGEPVMALASASQSIARYNPAQDRWEMIACPLDGPPAAAVRAGLQTADGTPNGAFWFATPEGLARTDGEEWQIFTSADGLPSDNVQTLATDGQRLWVGTDAGLSLYQDGLWQTVLVDDVRALSRGPDGALWYFSETGLFQLIDGRSPTAIPLPPVNQVYDQWAAADGFWIATDAGVFFWPTQGDGVGAWQTFPTADGQPMGEVTALAMAADGVMWAGTGQGVWQLAAGAWGLRPLPELAADGPITRLVAAADGSLFVGLYEGRVYRVVNGQTTAENPVLLGDEYAPVSAILLPGDALWLAHFGGGVSRGVGLPGERTWHRFETDDRQEMQVNSVAAALRTFWLGTDKGLLVITGQDGDWRCQLEWRGEPPDWAGVLVDHAGQVWGVNGQTFWRLSAGEKVRSGVLASPVTAVAPDGAVWVVTANGLVRHANGRRQLVETAAITGQITAVAPAAHGVLWVGTTDGLFGYDGRDWTHYTAADGLAANHVTHVAAAPDGSVWVGTVGGVSWLRP